MERKHPEAKCEECPLQKKGRYVPTTGNPDADIVVIGEAPGQTEAKMKEPFVGISGKVLNGVLANVDVDRQDTLLTNAIACRVSDKKAQLDPKAIACCKPRLDAEVKAAEPEYIMALGNTAASAALGRKTKITQERIGPPKDSVVYPGAKVIPSIHPAACLRAHDNFPNLVTDFTKLKMSSVSGWRPPKWQYFEKPTQAAIVLQQILDNPDFEPVSIDIECGKDKDSDTSHPNEILCIGIGYTQGKVAVIGYLALLSPKVRGLVGQVLRQKKTIFQNGKYDTGVFVNQGYIGYPTMDYDTMLASYCLDERKGIHSLEYLGLEFLGAPSWKKEFHDELGSWTEIATAVFNGDERVKEGLYKYNAYDCAITYDIHDLQLPRLLEEGQVELQTFLSRASNAITMIEQDGMKVDQGVMDELDKDFQAELDKHKAAIQEHIANEEFNPNSPQQVMKLLTEHYKVNVSSTDRDTLILLAEKYKRKPTMVEFCQMLLDYRYVQKRHSTYVKGIAKRMDENNVIRPTYKLHSTTTGRLSCVDPNVQNVPRGSKIRAMYRARPGYVLIQADYSNGEGRVVVVLSQDETMAKFMVEGRDVHSEMATLFFGSTFTYEQRVRAKNMVHGTNYGRTPHGIASDPEYNVTVEEANKIQQMYLDFCPGVRQWQQDVKRKVLVLQEDLVSVFGRKRRFQLITNENRDDIIKEALAWEPQSTLSDINLLSAVIMKEQGLSVKNIVHDSILVEALDSEAEDTAKNMQKIMEATAKTSFTDKMGFYVPFPVDYKIGDNWGEV